MQGWQDIEPDIPLGDALEDPDIRASSVNELGKDLEKRIALRLSQIQALIEEARQNAQKYPAHEGVCNAVLALLTKDMQDHQAWWLRLIRAKPHAKLEIMKEKIP